MYGSLKELRNLEIFNKPYKITFKGLIASQLGIEVHLLKTHGEIYALEINNPDNIFVLHDAIEEPEDIDFLLKQRSALYIYDKELTIDDASSPYYVFFNSNILIGINRMEKMYDPRTKKFEDVEKIHVTVNEETQNELTFEKDISAFKAHIFGQTIEKKQDEAQSLDEMISRLSAHHTPSSEEDNDEMTESMGCRKPPTIEDLAKNMEKVQRESVKMSDGPKAMSRILKRKFEGNHEER